MTIYMFMAMLPIFLFAYFIFCITEGWKTGLVVMTMILMCVLLMVSWVSFWAEKDVENTIEEWKRDGQLEQWTTFEEL